MSCSNYLPPFSAQNPAISGDPHGWVNCSAYSASMAAAYDSCGKVRITGAQIRAESDEAHPDPASPGLNLAQVDEVLLGHGVDLDVIWRVDWAEFERRIDAGQGAILALGYGPIADSQYDAGGGFRGNHSVFVAPGWIVMDPLADGRRAGIHKYDATPYPRELLQRAAAALVVAKHADGTVVHMGAGAYAAFTRDNRSTWRWKRHPQAPATRAAFWVYAVRNGRIVTAGQDTTRGMDVRCTAPRTYRWKGHPDHRLVRITEGRLAGMHVEARRAYEVP